MRKTSRVVARRGLLAAAAAGTLAMALGGGSAASAGGGTGAAAAPATITMELKRGKLQFDAPKRVKAGRMLRIRNNTSPRKIGPHTFTLASAKVLPRTRKAQERCFSPGKVCMDAAIAHELDEETEKIGRPLVEAGAKGWDRRFARKRTGDSWYTEKKGETFSQKVSAKPGTTLHFLCVVHPDMQGKIEVVGSR